MRFPKGLGVCPRCGLDVDAFDSPFTPEPLAPLRPQATAPAPVEQPVSESGYFFLLEDGRLRCPDCGMRFPQSLGVCPRCGLEVEGYTQEDEAKSQASAPAPVPVPEPEPARVSRAFALLDDGRLRCPDCGMRFPQSLGVCPRCGLAVASGDEECPPAPPPTEEPAAEERYFTLLDDGRLKCPDCGLRFPAKRGACPRCGLAVEDDGSLASAAEPMFPPAEQPASEERYFTLLDDGRLKCPDCGLRFPATHGACPRCGLGVE